jgi:hypothetical protein
VPRKFEFSPPGTERRNPEEVKANEAKMTHLIRSNFCGIYRSVIRYEGPTPDNGNCGIVSKQKSETAPPNLCLRDSICRDTKVNCRVIIFFWVLFVFVRCLDKATVHKNVKNLLGRKKIVIVIVTVIAEKNKNLNCRPVLRNDFVIGISCHV